MTKKVVNLTPHNITIVMDSGKVDIPPSGTVVRVTTVDTPKGTVNIDGIDVPVITTTFTTVDGLPDPQPDTIYLVSTIVLSQLKQLGIVRDDLFAPDTSPTGAVRNDAGQIIGVKRLVSM